MDRKNSKNTRPLALVILDGWGYAPRTDGNAIAIAHTPNYDEICRRFPMTTLSASGEGVSGLDAAGNAEVGHLSLGTGRLAETEALRIKNAIATGAFMENDVLNEAFSKAKDSGSAVHLIGLLSDGGVHSSTENLFAILRLAKRHGLVEVFVHCILDGLDVPRRSADVYVEALEIKMADIGTGRVATLCGRFFSMDSEENWERTARAYTMLVHGEGERTSDAVAAIRNSFLRGISDEFISPIVLEKSPGTPVTTVKTGDLAVFFNHRPDAMRQLVRSLSVPDGSTGDKPIIDTVCMTEYDPGFEVPVAFSPGCEKNALTEVLSASEVPNFKITETSRSRHLAHFFDGGMEMQDPFGKQIIVPSSKEAARSGHPESESFKITDQLLRTLESTGRGVFVINFPAADMMADTGDIAKTVKAIQYIDTCIGGICESMERRDGVIMITSTHGNCEEMSDLAAGERSAAATLNPVPFHYIDAHAADAALRENGSLEDVAPTILGVLGIEKPAEMTGADLRSI